MKTKENFFAMPLDEYNMCESIIWKFFDYSSVIGYTLIIPSIAVGNVGQLTCDLLISSLQMEKIASIYSAAQIPVIGYDSYDLKSSSLSTASDLYKYDPLKILVLQLRAPLVNKFAECYLRDLIITLLDSDIENVIILTSSFAHEKKEILSSPFRFIASRRNPITENIRKAKLVEHEGNADELKIPGSGFACQLYNICLGLDVPSMILYKYCSEGDNIPDAYDMIHNLGNLIPIFTDDKDWRSQLKHPVSWNLLFGRPPPQDIY